jgi:hypothetical protein
VQIDHLVELHDIDVGCGRLMAPLPARLNCSHFRPGTTGGSVFSGTAQGRTVPATSAATKALWRPFDLHVQLEAHLV